MWLDPHPLARSLVDRRGRGATNEIRWWNYRGRDMIEFASGLQVKPMRFHTHNTGLPFFSIVIPTYNRLGHLKETIGSIESQTFRDFEVIVVDDGSNDGTHTWLESRPDIRAFRQLNRGPGAARNEGIRHAQGEYIALLDSDDIWLPWTLDTFYKAIQLHVFPSILSGSFKEFTNSEEILREPERECVSLAFPDYLASSHRSYSVGSGNCVIRRSVLTSFEFLEDRLNGEDHDLILRLGDQPGFVQILSPLTLGWRRHPQSQTADTAQGIRGATRLVHRENTGTYPGGLRRSAERRRIIARHIRPVVLRSCAKENSAQAWNLYRETISWNITLGKWKYVAVVPLLLLLKLFDRKLRS